MMRRLPQQSGEVIDRSHLSGVRQSLKSRMPSRQLQSTRSTTPHDQSLDGMTGPTTVGGGNELAEVFASFKFYESCVAK